MALTWLVTGIGEISTRRVLPAILASPHSRLAGIVTRDLAKTRPMASRSWQSLDAGLAACAAEAVYVATPVFLHAAQTIAALRAGRHVPADAKAVPPRRSRRAYMQPRRPQATLPLHRRTARARREGQRREF